MTHRKADLTLILAVLALLGNIWQVYAKPAAWDQNVRDVAEIKPIVMSHQIQLAIIIEKLTAINDHVKSIDKKTP